MLRLSIALSSSRDREQLLALLADLQAEWVEAKERGDSREARWAEVRIYLVLVETTLRLNICRLVWSLVRLLTL